MQIIQGRLVTLKKKTALSMYKILLKLQKKMVFIKPIYLFEFEYFLLLLAFNSHSELRGFAAAINGTPSCRAVLERSRKVKDRNVKHTHTHARVCTHAHTHAHSLAHESGRLNIEI